MHSHYLLALQCGGGVLAHKQLDPQFRRRYLDVELPYATHANKQNNSHASTAPTWRHALDKKLLSGPSPNKQTTHL